MSGKLAVQADLDIAAWLEFALECRQPLGGVLHVMQHTAALNDVIDIRKLIRVENIELLEPNIVHVVLLQFPCRIGKAVLTDVNGSDRGICVATGVNNLVSGSASRNQNLRRVVG